MSRNIDLKSEAEMFEDYIVMLVDDIDGSLSALHQAIKYSLAIAYDSYRKRYLHDLFDKAQSERFPYRPHIALGRLQTKHLMNFMAGSEENKKKTMDTIKKRIREEVFPVTKSMLLDANKPLSIDSFYLIGHDPRTFLKRYPLISTAQKT